MFCPQCGQQQVSADTRFCSRCGLPLNLVAEVLAGGGSLPQLEEMYKGKRKVFSRRNGLIFSLFWCLFFLLILTPFWAILDVEELAAMSAILGIFGGLIIILFSFFFLKPEPKPFSNQFDLEGGNVSRHNLFGNKKQNVLPPPQSIPADYYAPPASGWKAPETGDLARPSSVTEETTKLLNKDKL